MLNNTDSGAFTQTTSNAVASNVVTAPAQIMALERQWRFNQLAQLLVNRFGEQGAQLLGLLTQLMNSLSSNVTTTQSSPPWANTIHGTTGNDTLEGSSISDLIEGHAGHDQLSAGAGDDFIFGGTGSDTLSGGLGHDRLEGESGNDTLFGGQGDDLLLGGNGIDFLLGGEGNDTLIGGRGDDFLHGGEGADLFELKGANFLDLSELPIAVDDQEGSLFRDGVDFIADFQTGVDKIDVGLIGSAPVPADFPPEDVPNNMDTSDRDAIEPTPVPAAISNVSYSPSTGQLWVQTTENLLIVQKLIAQFPPGTQIAQSDILNGNLVLLC